MAELKTKVNNASVAGFIAKAPEPQRSDAKKISALMQAITKQKPTMWGTSIVGFGQYHYKSASGREGDWMMTGFSPRKQNLTIYIMGGLGAAQKYSALLKKLGPHKVSGGSCLYLKSLKDVDMAVLKKIITAGYADMKKRYG